MSNALAAKYKLKMGPVGASSGPKARPVSRESVTPPDEPGTSRTHADSVAAGLESLPGEANLPPDKKKKRRKKKVDTDAESKQTALQMAMRSSQGMKGGTSVVRQFSMLQRDGAVGAAAKPVVVPGAGGSGAGGESLTGEDGEARESNQRKALKELMIKFEHNQRQMAEAQRQLIEGKTSVFSGVSRTRMGLMLLANNLTVIVCSFIVFVMVYNLNPGFDGSLGAGGGIQASGLRVVASSDSSSQEQKVQLSSATREARLSIRPAGNAADSSLVLMTNSEATESFSLSVPRSGGAGLAVSVGTLEAVAFDTDYVVLGKYAEVGNVVAVKQEGTIHSLELHDKLVKSERDLRAMPAAGTNLVLRPQGAGLVQVRGRDLKIADTFQVGPRQTLVTRGGLLADAGKVPTIGVDVHSRAVSVGSIVDPVQFRLHGESTFYGNLTVEHGDLNLVDGTLTLRDMNFGKVRSLSFNKGQKLGEQAADHVHFYGNMEMRDEQSELTFAVSANDGSIYASGGLQACTRQQDPPGQVNLRGSVVLGSAVDGIGGAVEVVGVETTMHSVSALGGVRVGSTNRTARIDIVGGVQARSFTPGLYSHGIDPLLALHPVHRTIEFGATLDVAKDAALLSRVSMRAGLGNRLVVRGSKGISGSAHMQNADLSVGGLAALRDHLNGTAMFVEGSLTLGLNETTVLIPRNETLYVVTVDNVSTTTTDYAAVLPILGNRTFSLHVVEKTMPLPPLVNISRDSQFVVVGKSGDVIGEGTVDIAREVICEGDVSLATKLDRVSSWFNISDNTSNFFSDPAGVTVFGTATAREAILVFGNVSTSTLCPEPPARPNSTNITVHLLLGFSNNTNESFPMPPCNHSFSMLSEFTTQDLVVNVSRYRFDVYGHKLFKEDWWETDPNITISSAYQYTRTTGGFRVTQSADLSNGSQTTLFGSLRVLGIDTPCFSNPCLNGATCYDEGQTAYSCDCRSLWTGQHCETAQQKCADDEDDCAEGARCAHTYPCEVNELWPGYEPRPGNPCPQEGGTFIIQPQHWRHECICPYGFEGSSIDRQHPALFDNGLHKCTLSTGFKYYVPHEPPGELQAIKVIANPASNDVFIKNHFHIRERSTFRSKTQFGPLRLVKEPINSSATDDDLDLADCVSEWDIRRLQRQSVCPNQGNPSGEALVSAEIFGFNQTYPGGQYYNPLFLTATMNIQVGSLGCEDSVQYRNGISIEGRLTCAEDYRHGNRSLTVLQQVVFGSAVGSTITVRGNLLAQCNSAANSECSGHANPFVVSPSSEEVAIEGNLRVNMNSTMGDEVVLGRSANNMLTILGELQLVERVVSNADVLVNSTFTAEASADLESDVVIRGSALFDVEIAGLQAHGYFLIQSNAITTFSVQTWARKVKSGTFTITDSVGCDGFISTGTLDASTLKIDSISGTVSGVGTTIEKSLIEGGGFRLIQVDELSEMYMNMPLQGVGDGTGGIEVSRVVLGAGQAFLALPPVVVDFNPEVTCQSAAAGACTYAAGSVPACFATAASQCPGATSIQECSGIAGCEYTAGLCVATDEAQCDAANTASIDFSAQNMSVTLATLQNSGHMAVMDGSVTTLGFMQYYFDDFKLEPMARSAAINAGTETDWTESLQDQNAFLTARTTFQGDLSERWRLRSNGDMDFGRGMVVCLAASGDTTVRGDVTAATSSDSKYFAVSSSQDEAVASVTSFQKSSLGLMARGEQFAIVVERDRLHIRGNQGNEELLQVTDVSQGSSLLVLGDALLCDEDSSECRVTIDSQDESMIRIVSRAENDAVLEIKTGVDETAGLTLQDNPTGNDPSQMNLLLYGSSEYDEAPLLALTDRNDNHLLDMYDRGSYMFGEIQGDVQFGGPQASESTTLTIFSTFMRATVDLTSGTEDSAALSLVGGHQRSAVINFVNPAQTGDARQLSIKTQSQTNDYQTLDFVDGECWIQTTIQGLDGSVQSETMCGHVLMSVRPDSTADTVGDLFVSGSGQFGSVDSSANTYRSLLHSADAAVYLGVESAASRSSMRVSAGYLNDSVLHLRESLLPGGQSGDSDLQILYHIDRTVEMLSETIGNITTYIEGPTQLFQSLIVRNDNHALLTLDVDTSSNPVSGNVILDGDARFCEQNNEAVCTVAVQSHENATMHVVSINSTADLRVSPAAGQMASLNLVTRLKRVMRLVNDHENAAMHLERTEVSGVAMTADDPALATLNRTHFLTLKNVNSRGKLFVPGLVNFGMLNSSSQCRVAVRSQLQTTLELKSRSDRAVMKVESDTQCKIDLKSWDPTIGNISTYSILTDDIMQQAPTLRVFSSFNSVLSVHPNATQLTMPYFTAINTTYFTGPPLNTTAWEFRAASNVTNFNGSLHTVGNVKISVDVVIGDTSKPMDHHLNVRSKQSATVSVISTFANAFMKVHAGRDRTASVSFAVHELVVHSQTGILTTPLQSTLSLMVRATELNLESLPTLSLTDGVMNDLFLLYDVYREVYGSSGYASLGGNVIIGSQETDIDHRLIVQASRAAKLHLSAGEGHKSALEVRSGQDVNQFINVDSVPYINPDAPPHTRAQMHLKCGLGAESFNNVNGSVMTLASGAQVGSRSVFDFESRSRPLFRMYPKPAVSNDTSQTFETHHLSLGGSATFGSTFHQADKNVTVKSSERATMRVVTGLSDDASMGVVSGAGQSAVLTIRNQRPFRFFAEEISQYGTGLLTLNTDTTDLLTVEEISAAQGGNQLGRSHLITVTGTLTALSALVVTNDLVLGDDTLEDTLSIQGKFSSPTLTFIPNPQSSIGFVLNFNNPANQAVITFPDTSTRPAGGGNILTALSTSSSLTEVATLTQGSIESGFGSISTERTINTTCLTSTGSSCGQIISSGNMTVQSLTSTQQSTFLGSAVITTSIEPVGTFAANVEVEQGNALRIQSAINLKTTAMSGHFDPLSLASPIGDREIMLPDIYRDLTLECACDGVCEGNPPLQCGPGYALVLYRDEVTADEVGGAYVDATTGVVKSFITLLNPGDLAFISMHNSQLTTDSIVIATISEFGSGGVVVVHAVTIMEQTDGVCVITIRNIGQDSMVGHFKVSFVIL